MAPLLRVTEPALEATSTMAIPRLQPPDATVETGIRVATLATPAIPAIPETQEVLGIRVTEGIPVMEMV